VVILQSAAFERTSDQIGKLSSGGIMSWKDPALEVDRIRRNTAPKILAKIDAEIEERIRYFATQPKEVIEERILELEREWDVERWVQANASGVGLAGLILGVGVDRRWLALTGGVLGFLLLHSTQGWCPELPVLRKLGIRTRTEIEREKFALKFLRGDFESVSNQEPRRTGLHALMQAVES
jgi:hypothetical protein